MAEADLPASRLPGATIEDRRTVYDGWLTLEVVVLDTRVRGAPARIRREVHDHGNGAGVLAYDPAARTAVLVRQLRAAALVADGDGVTVEAIAGLVDAGEDPAETVRREAMEEAGLTLGALAFVGAPYSSPGALTERVWLFLGEIDVAAPRAPGGGLEGEHEEIEVLEIPLDTLAALADAGRLTDMKTLLLVETLRRRRPDLFSAGARR